MGLFINPKQFQNDRKGRAAANSRYTFYKSGTTTIKPTYSDPALTSVNPNPMVADAAGRFEKIYLLADEPYTVVYEQQIRPGEYQIIWTEDNVTTGLSSADSAISIDSVADIAGLIGVRDDQQISLLSYHPNTTVGGGTLAWSFGRHDGVIFFDPNRTFPTPAQWANGSSDPAVIAWYADGGVDVDCWERVYNNKIDIQCAGFLFDGSDETLKLEAVSSALGGTGVRVEHISGNIKITKSVSVDYTLFLDSGGSIEVNGASTTPFINGGLNVDNGGALIGTGDVYTSGAMSFDFDGASTVFIGQSGMFDGPTVYGQLYSAVRSNGGDIRSGLAIGGSYRCIQYDINEDKSFSPRIDYYNAGIPYISKVPDETNLPPDSRAYYIFSTVNISKTVTIHTNSKFSVKNGFWINTNDTSTKFFENLIVTGSIEKAGYFIDSTGAEMTGLGAATCIEVLSAPDAVVDAITREALGYNVAIAANSHRARVFGHHCGSGGDPVVVVVDSDDVVIINADLEGGTVGLSVGEDGARADNCRMIGGSISKCGYGPVLLNACDRFSMSGVSVFEEPFVSSTTGGFASLGYVQGVVRCLSDTQDVVLKNNHFHGFFNMDVCEVGTRARVRVSRSGNTYSAPIIKTENTYLRTPFTAQTDGADFVRLSDITATTGHAYVGETTILGTDPNQYAFLNLNPLLTNLTALAEAGETLSNVLKNYAVLVHVKYVTGMDGESIRFGITDSFNASHTPVTFASPFGVGAPGDNIAGKWHTPNDGDFYPVIMDLDEVLYDPADPSALVYFVVRKLTNPTTYDLTITNPTLIYVGQEKKAIV